RRTPIARGERIRSHRFDRAAVRPGTAHRTRSQPQGHRERRDHDRMSSATMIAMTKARLDVVPLTEHIGAEIRGIDLRDKPDDETVKAIYQAWLDHLVIIFPDQKLAQEDFVRATGYFGELGEISRPAKYFPKGYSSLLPGIMMISNIR